MLNHNELLAILESDKPFTILAKILSEDAAGIAGFIQAIPGDKAVFVFRLLPKDLSAEVFEKLSPDEQAAVIEALTDTETGAVIDGLRPDAAMDFLEELPAGLIKKLLRNAKPGKRARINRLLKYPVGSAGSIMRVGFVDLKANSTVHDAFEKIRREGSGASTLYTCYVTGPTRHLEGLVTAETLMLAPPDHTIGEIMDTGFVCASTTDDQEHAARLFNKHGLITLPVVDSEKRLVGIITVDDILGVIREENTEDMEKMAAITPSQQTYLETGVLQIAKNRAPWLLILMISAMLTGGVLGYFENAILVLPVLMTFIPMLMGTGGNSGSQSATMVIRGMALGEIAYKDVLRVIWKEARVSLLVGVFLAAANFLRLMLFGGAGILVNLAVCLSLISIVTMANVTGGLLPIVAKKFGADPAVMASPFITTIMDVSSLFIFFNLARLLLTL